MSINLFYLLIIFIIINTRTYWLMYKDKKKAIKNSRKTGVGRVPEATLFLNSLFMGFVGIGLGMIFLRHKMRKPYFKIWVLATAIVNIGFYYIMKERLTEDFGVDFYFDTAVLGFAF